MGAFRAFGVPAALVPHPRHPNVPLTVEIDHALHLLKFRLEGEWHPEVAFPQIANAFAQIEAGARYDILSDHRGVSQPATPEQVKGIFEVLKKHGHAFAGQRAAIVVGSIASYDMMRMLSAHSDQIGLDVQVFWSPEEAMQFLRPAPAAGEIDTRMR